MIKKALGTTVNDVVLAACTESLRRYLIDHDDLPDRPLVASVPVSIRTDDDEGRRQQGVGHVRRPCPCSSRTRSTSWSRSTGA